VKNKFLSIKNINTCVLFLFLLVFPFRNGYPQDIPKKMRITVHTSGPVEYTHYIEEEPLALVVEFKTRNVFSSWEGVMIVNHSVIKEIQTEYYPTKTDEQGAVRSLIFTLTQKTSYEISQTGNAILIEVENPPLSEGEELSLGVIEIPQKWNAQRQTMISKAMEEVRRRLTPRTTESSFLAHSAPRLEGEKINPPVFPGEQSLNQNRLKEKNKSPQLFIYFLFPILILFSGFFVWLKRFKKHKKPKTGVEESLFMQIYQLNQELDKLKREKEKRVEHLTELENLKSQLINQQKIQTQLQETKRDLEDLHASKQSLADQVKGLENQLEQKENSVQELRNTKEVLLSQLKEVKELQVRRTEELKKGISPFPKDEEKETVPMSVDKAHPALEIQEENSKSPYFSLTKGMLVKLTPSDRKTPYSIGMARDISLDGIQVELDEELFSAESLDVSLFEYGSSLPMTVRGKLTSQEQERDSAKFKADISFFSISPDNQERLEEYMKRIDEFINRAEAIIK